MHNNIYQAILSFAKLPADLFFFKVNELIPETFEPIHKAKKGEAEDLTLEEKKTVVLYIIHAYSRESPMIISGLTEERNKKAIAEMVGVADYLRGTVLLLKDQNITQTIINYLDVQKERDWHHLVVKKRQYTYIMDQSILNTNDSEGKVDYKFILECAKSADTLLESIIAIEEKLNAKYKTINGAMDEVQKAAVLFEKNVDGDDLNIENAVRNKKK